MGFFGGSSSSSKPTRGGGSIEAGTDDGDSGFLHPESTLASNRQLQSSSAWSSERSSQQRDLDENHSPKGPGCCRRLFELAVGTLHIIDLCGGIAYIVYGSLLRTQFKQPAMEAAIFCMTFGSIHFISSSLGIGSYFRRGIRRFGLIVSAYLGPYLALVYGTIAISFGANPGGILTYLDDHKEVMYLGPNVAANVKRLMPLLITILIVLCILEASRWCIVMRLHDRLRKLDRADPLASHSAAAAGSKPSSSGGGNDSLTEALMEDDHGAANDAERGGANGGRETASVPNWWDHK